MHREGCIGVQRSQVQEYTPRVVVAQTQDRVAASLRVRTLTTTKLLVSNGS